MTRGLRIRVMVLQVGLIGILLFCAGFLFWGNSFIQGTIHDQMVAQKIYFPAAGSAGLSASEFPDLQQYGGQQVVDGVQAKAYADGFIGRHLEKVASGKTYSEVSAASMANPKDTKLAGQVQTLFRGETLRGLLLNAYGWWTVGQYALFAAIGLAVAAGAVFVAFFIEVALALRQRQKVRHPAATAGHPALVGAAVR
jgi:hypothetical protein